MCLAIPGKIIEIDSKKEYAVVDYGSGTKRKANIILVHAGFAIQVLEEKEAQETLSLFRDMLSAQEEQ
jgi:hydrogenase expression/formation protein HypC